MKLLIPLIIVGATLSSCAEMQYYPHQARAIYHHNDYEYGSEPNVVFYDEADHYITQQYIGYQQPYYYNRYEHPVVHHNKHMKKVIHKPSYKDQVRKIVKRAKHKKYYDLDHQSRIHTVENKHKSKGYKVNHGKRYRSNSAYSQEGRNDQHVKGNKRQETLTNDHRKTKKHRKGYSHSKEKTHFSSIKDATNAVQRKARHSQH